MELFFLAVLVLTMAFALGSGYPVAFALPGAAIISIGLAAGTGYLFGGGTDAYFHTGGPQQWLSAGTINLRGTFWEVERDTLIAIPLFIFMGIMLQRSKIAEDLLLTMASLFGPIPGGLGISVVFVGALLAATTGILGATVVAMGLISLPAMLRNGYSPSLASGTIAASGTLGQIIPPSIVLIILADQLASATDQASSARKALHKESTGELSMPSIFDVASTSAGEMFLGAFVPGLVLVGLYMLYILVYALIKPSAAPAVKYEGQMNLQFWGNVVMTLVPPLALIFLVLGSIIGGIATVNQAGAIGAAGAMIMAGYRLCEGKKSTYLPAILAIVSLLVITFALRNYEMNVKAMSTPEDATGIMIGAFGTIGLLIALIWSGIRVLRIDNTLQGVMLETAKTTSLVFIILLGAAMLTAAFRAFGGEELVREFLLSLPGGFWTQFIIVMAVIFFLGFFLDFIEIAVVVVPIVAPILLADPGANITAVWLGVMIGLNIQTSFLTPPFGFALFYLRGVAPAAVKTIAMYKGVIAFIALQLFALGIVGLYPPLVNYLPNRVSFLSDQAPPPRNPKLQFCMEDYVSGQLAADDGKTLAAIKTAQGLNFDVLPKKMSKSVSKAVDSAEEAIAKLNEAFVAADAVEAASGAYRPQLRLVRGIEKNIRREQKHLTEMNTTLGRLPADSPDREDLMADIAKAEAHIAELQGQIPDTWDGVHETFAKLTKAENDARNKYRRNADTSYEDVAEALAAMNDTTAYLGFEEELLALRATVEAGDPKETEALVNDLSKRIGKLGATDDVKKALGKARRKLKAKTPDVEAALSEYDKAIASFENGKVWRAEAETALRPGLETYLSTIEGTLGLRMQSGLTREQALFMASCSAHHRDISLNF
ncbi:TRAP transporter large permease subunit [Amylibacter sp. IMCC11727]|uniref:TRAP transporter large permease subunit n=1 Tax=Amylibacter sp. IMCC11727 TaxID=3039851 RepID=UPI00244DF716|nr:TRAP transporter large permease subunit [Amylibacter sp. IMCC11727]WGI20367.1 TRAP transporter large permease subunit [Amylibacter sp. IMCC11727]